MQRHTISLGQILGISVGLDYSWFLVFALITWTLAVGYYPLTYPTWTPGLYWLLGGATAILLFFSVLLHELGHSALAGRYGIPVRRITLFIFGGVAEINGEPPSARAEFWIAIAGPVVSMALAAGFGILQIALAPIAPAAAVARYLSYLNAGLALFNLIPAFPLDGGRIFRAIVWSVTRSLRRATILAATVGRMFAYLFILIGVLQLFRGNLINGVWIAFIGWFLESAAVGQVQQQTAQSLLAGHAVSEGSGDAQPRGHHHLPAHTPGSGRVAGSRKR